MKRPVVTGRTVAVMLLAVAASGTGCIGDFIPDRPDYSGQVDAWILDGFEFDLKDVVDESEVCARNCYDRVCGPDECGGTCGSCPQGTVCALDYSICLATEFLLPSGSICGRNAACEPQLENPYTPGTWYDNPDWPGCLDHQCAGLLCERGICTAQCVVKNDAFINGTTIESVDGIEDNTNDSDCAAATGDGYKGPMMCVGRATNMDGQLAGVCVPAASFAPCNPSSVCPSGEECGYLRIGTSIERRCMARIDGGAAYGEACGYDEDSGDTVLCESWQCTEDGCSKPCDDDDDCLSEGAKCEYGLCIGTGRSCRVDADCSVSFCSDHAYIDDIRVKACAPRPCSGDLGCAGDGHYCEPIVDFDVSGNPVASGRCMPVNAGGAPVGTPCGIDNGAGTVVCRNGDLCIDGICSATCGNDLDCFIYGPYRCGQAREHHLVGYLGLDAWVDVGYCVASGYGPEGCGTDSDCADDQVCMPWVRLDDGVPRVVTGCRNPQPDSWPLGTQCGEYAWDALCASGYCFEEDGVRGFPGWCSRTCVTDADCPATAYIGSVEYRWICGGMKISGGSSAATSDDLFGSWCVPVPAASSLLDCSADRWCGDDGGICSPVVRAGPPVSDERVDYVCLAAGEGGGDGTLCDPFGDGTDCASGMCAPSQVDSVGFCTHVCANDDYCSMFGGSATCEPVEVGRTAAGAAMTADICRMTGDCVICDDDTDCDASHRCANVAASYWYGDNRCVRLCEDDSGCIESPGTLCEAIPAGYTAAGVAFNGCMRPVCSQ